MRNTILPALLAAFLTSCASRPPIQEEPKPEPVTIETYLAELLRRSQNDVEDPRDFTVIHDDMRLALRRFDENNDGAISPDNPQEAAAFATISKLRDLGVTVLVGDEDMRDHVLFDHEEDVLYINPAIQDPREAAKALTHYLDKNPVFWELEARGWRPQPLRKEESAPEGPGQN